MKGVAERHAWGGGFRIKVEHFFPQAPNLRKNVRNRQEMRWASKEKNLDEKVDLDQKLEWFPEKKFFDENPLLNL